MVNNKNKKSNKGINNNIKEQTNIKQKRKTGSINRKKLIVVLLVVLIVLSFAIYKIIELIMNPTATFMVEEGSIYQEEDTTGYVIRDETGC